MTYKPRILFPTSNYNHHYLSPLTTYISHYTYITQEAYRVHKLCLVYPPSRTWNTHISIWLSVWVNEACNNFPYFMTTAKKERRVAGNTRISSLTNDNLIVLSMQQALDATPCSGSKLSEIPLCMSDKICGNSRYSCWTSRGYTHVQIADNLRPNIRSDHNTSGWLHVVWGV